MTQYTDRESEHIRDEGAYPAAPDVTLRVPADDLRAAMVARISWGAVSAGVVMALAVQFILNLAGIGFGATAFISSSSINASPPDLTIGAVIWWTVAGIVASFIGGYTAGHMAGELRRSTAGWHGLVSWSAAVVLIGLLMSTTIGVIMDGAFRSLMSTGGTNEVLIKRVTGLDPAALGPTTVAALSGVMTDTVAQAEIARTDAAQGIARAEGISLDDARLQVQQYERQYRTMTEVASRTVSRGAFISVIALLLGALAAWAGGRFGAVEPATAVYKGRREALH